MMDVVNLRLGDRVKRMTFPELHQKDKAEMIQFNKNHLTIIVPKIGFRSINYNPEEGFRLWMPDCGDALQRSDDFLRNYLSHFSEKSF